MQGIKFRINMAWQAIPSRIQDEPRKGHGVNNWERLVRSLLKDTGIELNGPNPWDITVKDNRLYRRVVLMGTLGFAEAYIDGWWDSSQMDELLFRAFRAQLDQKVRKSWPMILHTLQSSLFNLQKVSRARQVADEHFDLSNRFFQYMLGSSMAYTCAYWQDANTLDEAQFKKYDLICRKTRLQKGENILELGGGWGGFAKFVAEKYGCNVVVVNVAPRQCEFARELCKGLPVAIHQCDFRDTQTYNSDGRQFDKVICIGFAEHVGPKNYRVWTDLTARQLKDDGLFFVHTCGKPKSFSASEPFTHKYIFRNSLIPSMKQISDAVEHSGFLWVDFHDIGKHYVRTLQEWHENIVRNWNDIQRLNPSLFNDRFFRTWTIFLNASIGMARSKAAQLFQLVFSKRGYLEYYRTER